MGAKTATESLSRDYQVCPLCGAGRTKPLLHGDAWSVRACLACTNAYTVPCPQPVDYAGANFHQETLVSQDQATATTLHALPPQWRHSLLMQAERLSSVLQPGSHVLEIGCGEGLLLEELARRGLKVIGVEPSLNASATARSKGLDVRTGYFPGVSIEKPMQAVIMSHVLEHLPRPAEVLEAIDRIIDGGYILFVQTHWRGLVPKLRRGRWYAWVPEQHYWHFTPEGLGHLFHPLGWRTQAVDYSSLVHPHVMRHVGDFASRLPGLGDQFHLLAQATGLRQVNRSHGNN